MAKVYLTLKASEQAVLLVAGQIYSAYVATGHVVREQEEELLQRAVQQAIRLAQLTDEAVVSDGEVN